MSDRSAITHTAIASDERRLLMLMFATVALTSINYARTTVSPLQEAIRISLTLSDNQVALMQGMALALPVAIGSIPLGYLIDRYSRVGILLTMVVLGVLGTLITALASGFALLFVARCIVGLAATGTPIAAISLIADLYPPDRRGRAMMALTVGNVAGMSAAFALGGFALAIAGSAQDDWRWVLLWLNSPLLLVVLLVSLMREPARTEITKRRLTLRHAIIGLWRHRAMLIALKAGAIVVGMADAAALVWAVPVFSRTFGISMDRIGAAMATVLLISGTLAPIAGGLLTDWCHRTGGPHRTALAAGGLALLSLPVGLFAVAPSAVLATALLTVFLTLGFTTSVMYLTLFTIVIPNELRGLGMAIVGTVGTLFSVGLAPLTVSLLSDSLGGPTMIAKALACVCVASSLLGATTFAFASRYFPRRAAQ